MRSESERACDLCGTTDHEVVLEFPGPSMTSDSRRVKLPLRKVKCGNCSLVYNEPEIDTEFLETHYREDYRLSSAAADNEPLFFTESGAVPRSKVIFGWISDSLTGIGRNNPGRVLEIGCGEGSVLRWAKEHWPDASVEGIDLSEGAVSQARNRGLSASRGGYTDIAGQYDLIYAFAVIEHCPSPYDFLSVVSSHLSSRGVIVIAQPCQDVVSHDIFFVDHLFHFHSSHFGEYADRLGIVEVARIVGKPVIPAFSMHLFAADGTRASLAAGNDQRKGYDIRNAVGVWQERFAALDEWLLGATERPIVVWGVGEIFTLFQTYSMLDRVDVVLGVDDNAARYARGGHSFDVVPFDAELLGVWRSAPWLLTFRPRPGQLELLAKHNIDFHVAAAG